MARALWRVATRRGSETRHGTLQLVGYGILIGVLLWLAGMWAGFTLPLLADVDAVVSGEQPAAGQWVGPSITGPVRKSISEFLSTVHIPRPEVEVPPAPDLNALRERHHPVSDEQRFQQVLEHRAARRARLRALIEQNGWDWERDVDPGVGSPAQRPDSRARD
ncbi:MAG: hypothetical protein M3N52_05450 [Actinomycetota bacterium]|nr:hypothetical protein [Actinomycetota bacterium]